MSERQSELEKFLAASVGDPLYFVMGAFEWGVGELKPTADDPKPGPDKWQIDILNVIAEKHLSIRDALQIAVASGHGPGKSALIAWICLWFMATKPHGNGIVTANTSTQLTTKTWRELGVWHKRLVAPIREQFEMTATKIYHRDHERTWFIAAVPWSEKNPDAFAGQHAEWVLVIYDEASGIADTIWDTSSGAMTTPRAIWIAFGNPLRNTGKFHACFHKERHRWVTRQIDSRTAKKTNKTKIQQWVDDYGEDSDFVRVRVRGVFPVAGSSQFIPSDIVAAARQRFREVGKLDPMAPHPLKRGAKILGVDVARFGHNASIIRFRQGRYSRQLLRVVGLDTMQLAARVAEFITDLKPDAVFVDGAGVGGGVIDRLFQLGHTGVVMEVNGGTKASQPEKFMNLRAEMWSKMRDWIKNNGILDDDQQLEDDLTGPEYHFDRYNRTALESKDDMEERGLASPDDADALAHTFAAPVADPPEEDAYERRRRYSRDSSNRGSPMSA